MIKRLQQTLIQADKNVARARTHGTNAQLRIALKYQAQARDHITWYSDPLNAAAVAANLEPHDDDSSSMTVQGQLI